jgi:cytochrome c oxidase subunit II
MRKIAASLAAVGAMLTTGFAHAQTPGGQPTDWQMGLPQPATAIMEEIRWFEQFTLWFIIPITLLVLFLLAWCMIRYRASANPTPSRTSHNTVIEVIWTVAPVIILLMIAVPSFQLLTSQYNPPEEPEMTIKATGLQWFWEYEYQDAEETVSFASLMLREHEREEHGKEDRSLYPRLLAVDNEVVVPVDTTVRVLVTAADVIHAWKVPAFGVMTDAVPGRINEIWFKAEREGLYYGMCSELCGMDHAYMPIAVRVVSQELYDEWLVAAATDVPGANQALRAAIYAESSVAELAD